MRTILRTFLLFLVCFSVVSIQASAQDMDEMQNKIDDMNKQLSEAMVNGNNEMMLSFYADDIISLPSYSPMIEGKDALKEAMMMDANAGNKFKKFELTSKKIIPAGDLLIDIGTYTLSMDIMGMDQPYNDNGKYLTVYEKQDDGNWKIKADTWNSDMNPWMEKGNMEESKDKMD